MVNMQEGLQVRLSGDPMVNNDPKDKVIQWFLVRSILDIPFSYIFTIFCLLKEDRALSNNHHPRS
jgi:hypothetical protein